MPAIIIMLKKLAKVVLFMKKSYKMYINNIRWMTVTLVVLYHVIYMYNSVETAGVLGGFSPVQYQDAFQYIVYPWFMLLLFAVSGMCARFWLEAHDGAQVHKEFLRVKTRKLLVPSTIGVLVFWWTLGYYNMQISGVLAGGTLAAAPKPVVWLIMSLSGTGVLWYIQLLWVFCLVLIPVRRIERDRLYRICEKTNVCALLLLTVAVWGAAQVLNTPMVVVYRFGIYGLGFFIGYFCLSHECVMERLQRVWLPLVLAATALGIAFVIRYFGEPYAEHVVLDTPLCNVYAWIAVLAVLAVMKRYGNFQTPFTAWMNRRAWGLYIFHYLPLAVCAWYLYPYAGSIPHVLIYLITAAAAFAGAFLLDIVIRRIPVLRWCVLGIRKGDASCSQKI